MPTFCLRPVALVVAATAVATGSVACSSGPASQDQTGTSTTTSAPAEHGAYAACLTEHGMPAMVLNAGPGPATAPPGVDPAIWNSALQACESLAPGPPGPAQPPG